MPAVTFLVIMIGKMRGRLEGPPSVLAISSAGGHFVQLLRLMPAFAGCNLTVASTDQELASEVWKQAARLKFPMVDFCVVIEANRWQRVRLLRSALSIFWLFLRIRPDVVVTTGAAPGYFSLWIGGFLGARTIWIDSIANAEEISLAGQKAGRHADLWLTQWPDLAREAGPHFKGAVL